MEILIEMLKFAWAITAKIGKKAASCSKMNYSPMGIREKAEIVSVSRIKATEGLDIAFKDLSV